MYGAPAVHAEYVAQLAVGGVDGTLQKRLTQLPSPRVVRAKTGTLDDVIALSGYVLGRTPERVLAFSVIANAVHGKQNAARALADQIASDAAQHLWLAKYAAQRRSALARAPSYSLICLRILPSACSWSWRMRSRDRLYLSPISLSVSSSSSSRPKRQRMMRDSIGVSVVEQAPHLVAPLAVDEVLVRARACSLPAGSR